MPKPTTEKKETGIEPVTKIDIRIGWDKDDPNLRSNPAFWAWHPAGRGIGTGILHELFSNKSSFSTGFIYGALSGGMNVAMRPLISAHLQKSTLTSEHQALGYAAAATLPWIASAGILHQLNKIAPHRFFKISPKTAILSAVAVECFGYANKDLLKRKPTA